MAWFVWMKRGVLCAALSQREALLDSVSPFSARDRQDPQWEVHSEAVQWYAWCAGKDHAGLGAAFAAQSFGPVFRHGKRAGPRIARMPGPGFNLSVGIGLTEIRCATFAPHVRAMRPVCAKGRTALWDIDGAWRALACHDSATHRPEVKYGVGFEADPDHAVTSVESPGVTGS